MNYDAYAPFSGTEFDLAEGEFLYEAEGVKIQKPAALQKASKAAKVYEKLLALGYRLLSVIRKKRGLCKQKIWRSFQGMSNLYVINGTELMGKCYSLKRNPRDKNPGEVIMKALLLKQWQVGLGMK